MRLSPSLPWLLAIASFLANTTNAGIVPRAPKPSLARRDQIAECELVLIALRASQFCSSFDHIQDVTSTIVSTQPGLVSTFTITPLPCTTTLPLSTSLTTTTVPVSGPTITDTITFPAVTTTDVISQSGPTTDLTTVLPALTTTTTVVLSPDTVTITTTLPPQTIDATETDTTVTTTLTTSTAPTVTSVLTSSFLMTITTTSTDTETDTFTSVTTTTVTSYTGTHAKRAASAAPVLEARYVLRWTQVSFKTIAYSFQGPDNLHDKQQSRACDNDSVRTYNHLVCPNHHTSHNAKGNHNHKYDSVNDFQSFVLYESKPI